MTVEKESFENQLTSRILRTSLGLAITEDLLFFYLIVYGFYDFSESDSDLKILFCISRSTVDILGNWRWLFKNKKEKKQRNCSSSSCLFYHWKNWYSLRQGQEIVWRWTFKSPWHRMLIGAFHKSDKIPIQVVLWKHTIFVHIFPATHVCSNASEADESHQSIQDIQWEMKERSIFLRFRHLWYILFAFYFIKFEFV